VKIGDKTTYRTGLGLLAIVMLAMPFVAYHDPTSLLGSWSGEVAMWIPDLPHPFPGDPRDGRGAHVGAAAYHELVTVGGESWSAKCDGTDTHCGGTGGGSGGGRAVVSATSGKGRLGKLIPFGVFGGVAMLGFVASWRIRGGEAGWVDEVGGERSEEDRGRDQM
jgi:hypothetical protein